MGEVLAEVKTETEKQVYSILIGLKKVFTYFIVSGIGLGAVAKFDFVKANSIIDLVISSGGIAILAGVWNFIKFQITKKK